MKLFCKKTRVTAIILSICLLWISGFGGYAEVNAADATQVYFLNTEDWGSVYAYVWGDSEALGGWPGTPAQNNGGDWYTISVPRGAGFNVIFNNGGGSQAGNVYVSNSANAYLTMNADVAYSSKTAAESAVGYVNASTRVYFYNSAGWSTVSAYTYGSKEALGGWPGTVATADGNSWYYIDVPQVATDGFSIIFNDNNNGNQAGDVYITDTTNVYLTMAADTKYASKEAALAALGVGGGSGSTDSGNTGSGNAGTTTPDMSYDVNLSGVGATLPYVEMEAEDAATNGEILAKSITFMTDIQSEASGRSAVKLDATGEYVEFTLPQAANTLVLRYCMPDGNNGAGLDATLSLYVNGNHSQDLSVTSKYAWVYGEYPYNNNPNNGKAHRFFDEIRVFLGRDYAAGTTVRLQKDSGDSASYYIVDLVDFEQVGGAIGKPDSFLSITDYGAVANDNRDDYTAIVNCISAAKSQGKGVYIPAGTFNLNTKQVINVNGVTIKGAGMWHSNLYGAGAAFKVSGSCQFSDFAMTGVSTVRDDSGDLAGFEGYDPSNNVVIQNIWMEHMKVGCWFYNSTNLTVQGCRIRNTYADGINMCSNVNYAVVQNNHFRNTGDDSIAIWPWQGNSSNNTIQYNTVQCPTLANCIAVYGGGNNKVLNNHLADNISCGAGVNISTNFDTPNGFTGTITVENNVLERCGSYEPNYNYARGALWLWSSQRPITSTVNFVNNTVYDSSYSGITIEGGNEISNVNFTNNKFYAMKEYAVHVRGSVPGSATLTNHVVANVGLTNINKESAQFTINGGVTEGTMPENSESTGSGSADTGNAGTDGGVSANIADTQPVTLYQDINYGGYKISLTAGRYTLSQLQALGMKNDDITSLKVPFGYRVTLYNDDNFGGATRVLTADTAWIGSDFNDVTSSIVVEKLQYRIVSKHSGLCLDIAGGNTADGANVIQWQANGLPCQTWEVTALADGSFVISSLMNGKVLDVAEISAENGANIHVWNYVGQANQQWWINDVADGYKRIISKHSGKSLDVDAWSMDGGANIIQWQFGDNQANQLWKFEAVN